MSSTTRGATPNATANTTPGQIVILNGPPRSGKSSIVAAIQDRFPGAWMNLGVDRFMAMTPTRFQPGIGLRPGGERPDLEPLVVTLYAAMYESVAAHSRRGLNVVVDVGHHDAYSVPRGILPACAETLRGLPVLFVGVHCPLEVVLERRSATWGGRGHQDGGDRDGGAVPEPVRRWDTAVHTPGVYDLDVDTSVSTPEECAERIARRLAEPPAPDAFFRRPSG